MLPKKKKPKVAEGTGSRQVDEKRVRAISKIKSIQNELKKINVEEDNKVVEVLKEFSEIRRDIYIRRNKVLLSIEDFWLTVFFSHPALGEFLNGEDQKILHYLISLDVDERPQLGYSITLSFSSNPYFENEKLTKTFSFPDQVTAVVTGATIKWKEGLDKRLEDMRFFTWLSRTQQIPFSATALDEVACIIKGCLWPDPLKYIITDKSLHGISVQNVDDEGAEFDAAEGGQCDDEIDEEQEGGEFDADDGGQYDVEIDQEQEGEEESGEFDVNESGQDDDELDLEEEGDEEGGEFGTNEGGQDNFESEEQEDEEGREFDVEEEQEGDEDDSEFDVEEDELDDDEIMDQEEDEEDGQGDVEIEQEEDDEDEQDDDDEKGE